MSTQFVLQDKVNFPVAMWITSPLSAYQGCAGNPFKLYLYTEDDGAYKVDLYAQGSNSIPWQVPQNKWSHLNPQWRFTDLSGNVVNEIFLTNATLTTFNTTTGYLASAEFYYIDDMPALSSDPVMLWATVDFSQHPAQRDLPGNTQSVSSFTNSKILTAVPFTVKELTPSHLIVTRDGLNPMYDFYWINTAIPHIVSVIGTSQTGSCTAVMKNFPVSNLSGISIGPIVRSIGAIPNASLTWTPANTSSYLSAFDYRDFVVGGYIKCDVLSTQEASAINIYASLSSTGLSGISSPFDVLDFKGYDVRRFNESWDAVNQIKNFARSPHIADNPTFWDKYMKAVWGDAASEQGTGFGRESYERAANFVANHADVNVCGVNQLYSLAQYTDVPIDEYGIEFPTELKRIMDMASVNQQYLWGARCNCNKNITNAYSTYLSGDITVTANTECEFCGHVHAGNRGVSFDPNTYMVSAFVPFIIQDRTNNNNKYQLITPPISCNIVSTGNVIGDICVPTATNVSCLTTYPLSSYYYVMLPHVFDFGHTATWGGFQQAITYFCFYNYVSSTVCDEQIGGVINWDDPYTTLNENASSMVEWYGDGQTLERIINYVLHKGLDLIED